MLLGSWGSTYNTSFYNLSFRVAEVNDSIDIIARAFSSGTLYEVDENGERTQDTPLVQFLLEPNKNQTFQEFSKEYIRNLLASGYSYLEPTSENDAFVRRLDRLDSESRPELHVLNTDYIEYPNPEQDSFVYTEHNTQETKNFEDIIPFWDLSQDPCNYRIGVSRMLSLRDEITNIMLAGRAKTNKIKQSGKFLVTPKTSGLNNQIGLQLDQPIDVKNPKYKQRDFIEDKLEHSGLANDKSITVTNKEMASTNVMESIQSYSYDEEIKEDKRTVKNTFGIPRELQNIGDDQAKYSDRKEAYLELFTLNVIPIAENFTQIIQDYYDPNSNTTLILDFSHDPAFEIKEEKKEQKIANQVDRLLRLAESGYITEQQMEEKLTEYEII